MGLLLGLAAWLMLSLVFAMAFGRVIRLQQGNIEVQSADPPLSLAEVYVALEHETPAMKTNSYGEVKLTYADLFIRYSNTQAEADEQLHEVGIYREQNSEVLHFIISQNGENYQVVELFQKLATSNSRARKIYQDEDHRFLMLETILLINIVMTLRALVENSTNHHSNE